MLVLCRNVSESVMIGPDIIVTVCSFVDKHGNRISLNDGGIQVKLGFDAPRAINIFRSELVAKVGPETLFQHRIWHLPPRQNQS
jgi:carbon storage regulator CsrA